MANNCWQLNSILRYYSHSRHLKEIFEFPIKKICVDAGFTCPNRDGSKGYGGYIYCNDKGSGALYINKKLTWEDQFRVRVERHLESESNTRFIIYFQAFSNMYAPVVEYFEQMYRSALSKEKVVGLFIGTRPDCVNSESLDLIRGLSRETYIWLEYGVETIHEKTLQLINRQHTSADLLNAYNEVKNGILTFVFISLTVCHGSRINKYWKQQKLSDSLCLKE